MISAREAAEAAKKASPDIMYATPETKNAAILKIADELLAASGEILSENEKDVKNAENAGTKASLIDRLRLTEDRIKAIAEALSEVAELSDPIGEVIDEWSRPNGLKIKKVRVPMGVIGIIYEARPNVTVDAAVLCLKAGSAVVLRGGSDAVNSNLKIAAVMRRALRAVGLSEDVITIVSDTSHESAKELMTLSGTVDLLIPRGGAGLIQSVVKNATVPVIETGTGNCHIYVDSSADFEMAKNIIINAKTQRTGVCNAAESLLAAEDIAKDFVPFIVEALNEKGCEVRGCEKSRALSQKILPASEEDYGREYLDLIISLRVVKNVDEAIEHIEKYSTHHSEAIITNNAENAQKFLTRVSSAAVYVNASTRFTDGGEFGFGAEMGISTQKLHARGPMGLREITTYKYQITGNGQVRG